MADDICRCQDSDGVECGRDLTDKEIEQDGMCQNCGDNLWAEIAYDITWTHN